MELQPRTIAVALCSLFCLLSAASGQTWNLNGAKYEVENTITASEAYNAVKIGIGAIVGISIAVLVAIVVLIIACCWCCCRRKDAGPTTVVVQQPMQPMGGGPQVNLFAPAAAYPAQPYPQEQVATNPSPAQPPAYKEGAVY